MKLQQGICHLDNMKESLKLLRVLSSGIGDRTIIDKSDDEIFEEANILTDCCEKVAYLKRFVGEKTTGYLKSKLYLASLVKKCDYELACKLIHSICYEFPTEPSHYFAFAEIAIENNAWIVAKSVLETTLWLSKNKEDKQSLKCKSSLEFVLKKIKNNEKDNSLNDFWKNKEINKGWILQRLNYTKEKNVVIEYTYDLLNNFSEDIKNYEAAYIIFSRYEDDVLMKDLTLFISENKKINNDFRNLYLGQIYYDIGDFSNSIKALEKAKNNKLFNSKALLYLALNHLLADDMKSFTNTFNLIIPGPGIEFIALYFIYSALSNIKLNINDFADQQRISYEITRTLWKIYKLGKQELFDKLLKCFEILNYDLVFEYIKLNLAEKFIKENEIKIAKELILNCNNIEALRLKAWICRIEENEKSGEEELTKYRKGILLKEDKGLNYKLINLSFPKNIPQSVSNILNIVLMVYEEAKEIIKDLDIEYGTDSMICIEAKCQDCCKKSFPFISYVEYLYMKNYLDNQDEKFKVQILKQSKEIVNNFKEKYKKTPPFITIESGNGNKKILYPGDFKFDCPFLGDNKCNIYEARPFMCRAFGYGSIDGTLFRGCNYFFEQLKAACELTNTRKVLNIESFNEFARNVDIKLIGKKIIAPIPVWFAQSHEETLEKIKKL